MSLKASFVSYLNQKYPALSTEQLSPLVSDQLLSPFQIKLSQGQISKIKQEVQSYWALREWGQKNLSSGFESKSLRRPTNYSVCMSYDFHINPQGQPELIEINTNAAFLGMGVELYEFLKLKNPISDFSTQDLVQMFVDEIKLSGQSHNSVAIVDEAPTQQRLYVEFLVFKQMLLNNNFEAEIFDISQIDEFKKFSLIYNRYTDFYLEENKSRAIRDLYNNNQLQLSPQPYDYYLLADKERLLDWNAQSECAKPTSLLKIHDLGKSDRNQIWADRKNLFFKPKTSYGGKQAYKGSSISRKVFDEVSNENFIAQQLSVPDEVSVELNSETLQFKYDLRCYAYQNKPQLIVARLYQGQTTNLKTTGGGFACVVIE
ncbi:hypothetical protein K2P97_01290 [bacterium]|nr:hypothetical protein [bacterium]